MTKCYFCGKGLPESGGTILYAKGMLHAVDPELLLYPVCIDCLKLYGFKLCKLKRVENGK